MNILVIQGPNLNLIGLKSAQIGERITLDKINTALRRKIRNQDILLKILQSHKIEKAVTLIHRNRNWADGILLAPAAWAKYEFILKETLALVKLPVVEIYFTADFSLGTAAEDSILKEVCIGAVTEHPTTVFQTALDVLLKHLFPNS